MPYPKDTYVIEAARTHQEKTGHLAKIKVDLLGEVMFCDRCGHNYVGLVTTIMGESNGQALVRRLKELKFVDEDDKHKWIEESVDHLVDTLRHRRP